MTIKSALFYWVECDAQDCDVRCPEESDEMVAWSDDVDAWTSAEASEWKHAVDGKHYCYDHASYVCEQCGKFDPEDYPGERDYLCREHSGDPA